MWKLVLSGLSISNREATQSLSWIIRLRWLIVSLFFITFILIRQALPQKILLIILACCAMEYFHNILLYIINRSSPRSVPYILYLSPVIDMIIVVTGVYLSGRVTFGSGVLYIVPFVYSVPIVTTSIVLSVGAGLLVAGVASLLFAFLAIYGFFKGVIEPVVIFIVLEKIIYFFVIAFLSGYLAYLARKKTRELEDSHNRLEQKNRELMEAQQQLVQSEKIASIAQITVSLNHEINNPLTSVLADIQFVLMKLKANHGANIGQVISCLETAEQEALRIKALMEDLRNITDPVVEEYIPGISMINIQKSTGKKL